MLLVDDSKKIREMLKSMLRFAADSFYECEDGEGAFDAYQTHRPDWVLMDVKMKHLDGIAATRTIKSKFPDAKIIIVTQYDDPFLRQEAKEAGAFDYVLKENIYSLPDVLKKF
jgi:two-component system response regulator DegU